MFETPEATVDIEAVRAEAALLSDDIWADYKVWIDFIVEPDGPWDYVVTAWNEGYRMPGLWLSVFDARNDFRARFER